MRECKYCAKPLEGRKNAAFCNATCAAEHNKRAWRERNPKSPLGALATGTVAEANAMRVAIDLLALKQEVFRAAFPVQSCDFLLLSGTRIKVTTGNYTAKGTLTHPKCAGSQFDVLAVVTANGDIHYLDRNFKETTI